MNNCNHHNNEGAHALLNCDTQEDQEKSRRAFVWQKSRRKSCANIYVSGFALTISLLIGTLLPPCNAIKSSENSGGPNLPLPYHEELEIELQDEENDEKLYNDILKSISEWQKIRASREKEKRLSKHLRYKRDEEVVCYGDLGCFRDEGPFDYLDMLPSPPEEVNTRLQLFTRNNLELPQYLAYNNISSVLESNFNATNPIKIIIHGFGSGCNRVWPREMRLSFLAVENCNVICVDWSAGAADPNYVRAAVNTRLVGKQVAIFMKMINEWLWNSVVPGDINKRTHLVGFSLGAHVAGFAGSELSNLSRITGTFDRKDIRSSKPVIGVIGTCLDPAGPLFEGYDPKVRLDKTDANYVDVIHSNGESLIVGGFGVWEPIGHVDFYPNGGRAQRGCQHLLIGGLYDFIYSYSSSNETYRYLCNHRRAYKLFTNSISPKCQFTAFPCESYEKFESGACFSCSSLLGECGKLGYYSDKAPGRGSLYLLTRDEEPFCGNQYKINVMFTSTRVPIQTYGRIQILLVDKDGLNETHSVTKDVDDLLTSGAQIENMVVVHPAIIPVEAHILYVAYEGWIYSGRYQWSLDKLILTDSYGNKKSFCQDLGKLLPSGLPVKLKLTEGDCVGSTLGSPEYPILPFQKYPAPPHELKLHPPRKPIRNLGNRIKTGSGQDAVYISNVVSIDDAPRVIDISDQVAPMSLEANVPAYVSLIDSHRPNDLGPPYLLDKEPEFKRPHSFSKPVRGNFYGNPNNWSPNHPQYGNSWGRPPYHNKNYPYHNYRPPQSYYSNDVRYGGVDYPMMSTGSHQFPARRRPSTLGKKPSLPIRLEPPPPPSPSNTIPKFTVQKEVKIPNKPISSSGLNEAVKTKKEEGGHHLQLVNNPLPSSINSTVIDMEMMKDDQLTIVKLEHKMDSGATNNKTGNSTFVETEIKGNHTKADYIVLHNLPNGEGLNLENLKTYNMTGIENGQIPQVHDDSPKYGMGMYESPSKHKPRSFNSFDVSEGNDELSALESKHPQENPIEHSSSIGNDTKPLTISERPPPTEEVFNPQPLETLEDLVAMPADHQKQKIQVASPVTMEPAPMDHPYFVNFKDPQIDPQAHMELMKIKTSSRARKLESSPKINLGLIFDSRLQPTSIKPPSTTQSTTTPSSTLSTTPNTALFKIPETTDGSKWIPIEKKFLVPTFGPVNKPEGYLSPTLSSKHVGKLSKVAHIRTSSIGAQSPDKAKPLNNPSLFNKNPHEKDRSLGIRRPGYFRQNKIAPIFKYGYGGHDRHGGPHIPRKARRIPGTRHSLPFRRDFVSPRKPSAKLWWQPPVSAVVSDSLEAPTALIRHDFHVDDISYEQVDQDEADNAEILAEQASLEHDANLAAVNTDDDHGEDQDVPRIGSGPYSVQDKVDIVQYAGSQRNFPPDPTEQLEEQDPSQHEQDQISNFKELLAQTEKEKAMNNFEMEDKLAKDEQQKEGSQVKSPEASTADSLGDKAEKGSEDNNNPNVTSPCDVKVDSDKSRKRSKKDEDVSRDELMRSKKLKMREEGQAHLLDSKFIVHLSEMHPTSALHEICIKLGFPPPNLTQAFECGPPLNKVYIFKAIVNGQEYMPSIGVDNKKDAKARAAWFALQEMGFIKRDPANPL